MHPKLPTTRGPSAAAHVPRRCVAGPCVTPAPASRACPQKQPLGQCFQGLARLALLASRRRLQLRYPGSAERYVAPGCTSSRGRSCPTRG
eukprot:scaffold7480_cov430-Prasinococcus_capsulatus_cf.AAC.7